jgi:serine/threonine protein kinase
VLYIAMRFVAGGDLAMLARRVGGSLEPAGAASLIAQVASALDAAHAAGLVHRDVKPGNILVGTAPGAGRTGHVYLSDFGLTKSSGSATALTATGQFLGTPDYCAPEQIAGQSVDGRTDISPDGKTVEVYPNGTAPTTLWDVATQANITPRDPRWPHQESLDLFSTDGKVIVTLGNNDASAVLWNVATHSYLFTVRYPGHVSDQVPFALSLGVGELVTRDSSKAGEAAGRVYLWHLH